MDLCYAQMDPVPHFALGIKKSSSRRYIIASDAAPVLHYPPVQNQYQNNPSLDT